MRSIADVLREATRQLESSASDSPQIEARLLAEAALGRSRVWIYQHLGTTIDAASIERLHSLVDRRAAGEPLAYIIGTREFFGRSFIVDHRVLIPRPETETLLERALQLARARFDQPALASTGPRAGGSLASSNVRPVEPGPFTSLDLSDRPMRVVDVGTGCGILGISLALALPSARVVLVDCSADALDVARENCRRHGVDGRVDLVQADLLNGIDGPIDLIVANLPYVPTDEINHLQIEVQREPRLALDGGADGLDLYRRLFSQATSALSSRGSLVAEIGDRQGGTALQLARASFPDRDVRIYPDLEGRDRVVAVSPRLE